MSRRNQLKRFRPKNIGDDQWEQLLDDWEADMDAAGLAGPAETNKDKRAKTALNKKWKHIAAAGKDARYFEQTDSEGDLEEPVPVAPKQVPRTKAIKKTKKEKAELLRAKKRTKELGGRNLLPEFDKVDVSPADVTLSEDDMVNEYGDEEPPLQPPPPEEVLEIIDLEDSEQQQQLEEEFKEELPNQLEQLGEADYAEEKIAELPQEIAAEQDAELKVLEDEYAKAARNMDKMFSLGVAGDTAKDKRSQSRKEEVKNAAKEIDDVRKGFYGIHPDASFDEIQKTRRNQWYEKATQRGKEMRAQMAREARLDAMHNAISKGTNKGFNRGASPPRNQDELNPAFQHLDLKNYAREVNSSGLVPLSKTVFTAEHLVDEDPLTLDAFQDEQVRQFGTIEDYHAVMLGMLDDMEEGDKDGVATIDILARLEESKKLSNPNEESQHSENLLDPPPLNDLDDGKLFSGLSEQIKRVQYDDLEIPPDYEWETTPAENLTLNGRYIKDLKTVASKYAASVALKKMEQGFYDQQKVDALVNTVGGSHDLREYKADSVAAPLQEQLLEDSAEQIAKRKIAKVKRSAVANTQNKIESLEVIPEEPLLANDEDDDEAAALVKAFDSGDQAPALMSKIVAEINRGMVRSGPRSVSEVDQHMLELNDNKRMRKRTFSTFLDKGSINQLQAEVISQASSGKASLYPGFQQTAYTVLSFLDNPDVKSLLSDYDQKQAAGEDASDEREALDLMANEFRKGHGLDPDRLDAKLRNTFEEFELLQDLKSEASSGRQSPARNIFVKALQAKTTNQEMLDALPHIRQSSVAIPKVRPISALVEREGPTERTVYESTAATSGIARPKINPITGLDERSAEHKTKWAEVLKIYDGFDKFEFEEDSKQAKRQEMSHNLVQDKIAHDTQRETAINRSKIIRERDAEMQVLDKEFEKVKEQREKELAKEHVTFNHRGKYEQQALRELQSHRETIQRLQREHTEDIEKIRAKAQVRLDEERKHTNDRLALANMTQKEMAATIKKLEAEGASSRSGTDQMQQQVPKNSQIQQAPVQQQPPSTAPTKMQQIQQQQQQQPVASKAPTPLPSSQQVQNSTLLAPPVSAAWMVPAPPLVIAPPRASRLTPSPAPIARFTPSYVPPPSPKTTAPATTTTTTTTTAVKSAPVAAVGTNPAAAAQVQAQQIKAPAKQVAQDVVDMDVDDDSAIRATKAAADAQLYWARQLMINSRDTLQNHTKTIMSMPAEGQHEAIKSVIAGLSKFDEEQFQAQPGRSVLPALQSVFGTLKDSMKINSERVQSQLKMFETKGIHALNAAEKDQYGLVLKDVAILENYQTLLRTFKDVNNLANAKVNVVLQNHKADLELHKGVPFNQRVSKWRSDVDELREALDAGGEIKDHIEKVKAINEQTRGIKQSLRNYNLSDALSDDLLSTMAQAESLNAPGGKGRLGDRYMRLIGKNVSDLVIDKIKGGTASLTAELNKKPVLSSSSRSYMDGVNAQFEKIITDNLTEKEANRMFELVFHNITKESNSLKGLTLDGKVRYIKENLLKYKAGDVPNAPRPGAIAKEALDEKGERGLADRIENRADRVRSERLNALDPEVAHKIEREAINDWEAGKNELPVEKLIAKRKSDYLNLQKNRGRSFDNPLPNNSRLQSGNNNVRSTSLASKGSLFATNAEDKRRVANALEAVPEDSWQEYVISSYAAIEERFEAMQKSGDKEPVAQEDLETLQAAAEMLKIMPDTADNEHTAQLVAQLFDQANTHNLKWEQKALEEVKGSREKLKKVEEDTEGHIAAVIEEILRNERIGKYGHEGATQMINGAGNVVPGRNLPAARSEHGYGRFAKAAAARQGLGAMTAGQLISKTLTSNRAATGPHRLDDNMLAIRLRQKYTEALMHKGVMKARQHRDVAQRVLKHKGLFEAQQRQMTLNTNRERLTQVIRQKVGAAARGRSLGLSAVSGLLRKRRRPQQSDTRSLLARL